MLEGKDFYIKIDGVRFPHEIKCGIKSNGCIWYEGLCKPFETIKDLDNKYPDFRISDLEICYEKEDKEYCFYKVVSQPTKRSIEFKVGDPVIVRYE
jgi:hypothetical protein